MSRHAKFDQHVHVTMSKAQRAKLTRKAKRTGAPISVIVRRLIDDSEALK